MAAFFTSPGPIPELNFANSKNMSENMATMTTGAAMESQLRFPGLKKRNDNELVTTETELSAIAKPASSGLSTIPIPTNMRAATGMPTIL